MAALHCFQLSTVQTSVRLSYFSFDFDLIYGRLHGLIRACISDSLAFTCNIPLNDWVQEHTQVYSIKTGML